MNEIYVWVARKQSELDERSCFARIVTYSKRDAPDARATRVRLVRAMLADEDVEAVRVYDVCGRKQDGQIHIEESDVHVEYEPRWWQFWRRR
jgi:hypothetical protein